MMVRLQTIRLSVLVAVALILLPVAAATVAQAAGHRASHHHSLVRCVVLSPPPAHRVGGFGTHGAGRTVQRTRPAIPAIDHGRFFAPLRQAMFFSRPGKRCLWHDPARHG